LPRCWGYAARVGFCRPGRPAIEGRSRGRCTPARRAARSRRLAACPPGARRAPQRRRYKKMAGFAGLQGGGLLGPPVGACGRKKRPSRQSMGA
jgi:hypothetical protein